MKSNIILVGLDDVFNKKVAEQLSDKYGLYLLDVKDFIEYDLINTGNVIKICGIEYLKKQENKIITAISTYENTLINIPYEYFAEQNNYKKLKENGIVVYIRAKEEDLDKRMNVEYYQNHEGELVLSIISYNERDQLLKQNSDICVDYALDIDKVIQSIDKKLDK